MTTFKELNLNNNLIAGLKKQNITEPTKVQSLTINKILDNKDLIVNAQTEVVKLYHIYFQCLKK